MKDKITFNDFRNKKNIHYYIDSDVTEEERQEIIKQVEEAKKNRKSI